MPTFRFRLDPVLALRRRDEDACERDLATAEANRREVEAALRRRQEDLVAGKAAMRTSLVGPLDAVLLRQQAASTISVDRLARRAVLELAGHAQRVAKARLALMEATRRRRAIELVRDRRFEEWRAARERRETAALDELSQRRTSEPWLETAS